MKSHDVLLVTVSDMHSGSNTALFLNREWHGAKTSHIPRAKQVIIRKQWELFTEQVAVERKGKRVILVHNGDAIDGDHHASGDVCTTQEMEQADIHIEIMAEFQKKIKWDKGDTIYYTSGTEVHTGLAENYIGREMNAVMNEELYVFDFLTMQINGKTVWFAHHGPGAGEGANEGNSVRNWLRNIHLEAEKDERPTPHAVYTGHVHVPTYGTYVYRKKYNFDMIHGIITPSWQMKTRYAHMRAPVQKNKIGGVTQVYSAEGYVGIPKFCVLPSD